MENNMKLAVKYFEDMGIPIKNGLIDSDSLTEEQLGFLKKWRENTKTDGIDMPEIQDFYRAVLVAISLNPQKTNNGDIRYLFGKGIGVEIALRGKVKGRKVYGDEPIYRSHSDFELYDAKVDEINTKYFQEVFGSQEYFPKNRTKGLRNIPEGEMDKTYEIADLDGYEILIPKLEILFLDKFLMKEDTPRKTGYDCDLLAERYELEQSPLNDYIEKYYFKYMIDNERENNNNIKKVIGRNIIKNLNFAIEDDNATNIEEAVKYLNEQIDASKKINEQMTFNGIKVATYVPLTLQDITINEQGEFVLSKKYIDKIIELISNKEEIKFENMRKVTLEQMETLLKRAKENKKYNNKFSEQEIGKVTINTVIRDKDASKDRLQKDIKYLDGKGIKE